jgi:urease accessory protein
LNAALDSNSTAGWHAELRLKFAGVAPTRLVSRQHRGPLLVQRPFYPEGAACHVYLVHPPGGIVGGDELRIEVQVEPGSHAVITTPAATKFYRCAQRPSSQSQELRLAGGTLEWLPQENIFYPGADTRTATRVYVGADSRFIGWEISCLGLPARGESFDAGALSLDFELWRNPPRGEPTPLFIDRLRLRGESTARAASWGLAGFEAIGTLLATPADDAMVEILRPLVEPWPHAAVTLVDGVLVVRALAAQAWGVRRLFHEAWRLLRPAFIGRDSVPPRIWST